MKKIIRRRSIEFKTKLYKIAFTLIIFFLLTINVTCNKKTKIFYVKSGNTENLRIRAFEICGKNFEIIAFEEDTALVKCN